MTFSVRVARLCAVSAAFVIASAALAQPHTEKDVTYATRTAEGADLPNELQMNVAVPAGLKAGERRACIVCIHGGGWAAGNRRDLDELTRQLAAQGFVAATVSYRFAPKDRFPAQIIDCADAVRFLRVNAARFGIDPDRIGAVGFSAGAHLSMLLGVGDVGDGLGIEGSDAGAPSAKVQAVVAFFGPTLLGAADFPAATVPILDGLIGKEEEGHAERARKASPLTYVTKGDAPMLLFQGTADPLVPSTQATIMADAMSKAGVPGRAEIIAGAGHGWSGAELERTFRASLEFFKGQLGDAKKETKTEQSAAKFTVDSAAVPDLNEWGENAKKVCEEWYPKLCKEYASEGFVPRGDVTILFRKKMRAPAATGGGTISVSGEYVHGHTDDVGMMVHELMHVVQAYPGQKGDLGWLTEGIADYVRFWEYEPQTPQRQIDGKNASYRNSYRTSAAFLGWLVKKYDPQIVVKLNARMRKGGQDEAVFNDLLGKSVDDLWAEFVAAGAPSSPAAMK